MSRKSTPPSKPPGRAADLSPIGKVIAGACKAKRWKFVDFARAMGVKRQRIGDVVHGRWTPKVEWLVRAAVALEIPASDFGPGVGSVIACVDRPRAELELVLDGSDDAGELDLVPLDDRDAELLESLMGHRGRIAAKGVRWAELVRRCRDARVSLRVRLDFPPAA